jgi:hypothetical protein
MLIVSADLSDWKTGNYEMIREYMKPIPSWTAKDSDNRGEGSVAESYLTGFSSVRRRNGHHPVQLIWRMLDETAS